MKIKHLAMASAVFAAAGAAHAQSSVTLYGLIDTSIVYQSNVAGATKWMENSGTLSTSRWGLRGSEDLGGGLSAVFDLENGFMSNNGGLKNSVAGNVPDLFGRQAWVGISSKDYGALTLGRQYDFMVDYVAPMSATGSGFGGNISAHPFDNDNLDNDMRLNNAVKFSSVSFNGLKVGAMYAFSGQAGNAGNNNAYSLGASYAMGPINLAAAYVQVNRNATLSMANASGAVSTTDGDQLTSGGSQQIWGAGAQYKFGQSTVGVVYTHSITYNVTGIFGGPSTFSGSYVKFDNFEINGRYFLRPDLSLGAAYTYTMGSFASSSMGNAKPHWHQAMAQVDYSLSHRTDLYLEGVYQRTGGGNGIAAFNAQDYNYGYSSGKQQITVGAGLRHRF